MYLSLPLPPHHLYPRSISRYSLFRFDIRVLQALDVDEGSEEEGFDDSADLDEGEDG